MHSSKIGSLFAKRALRISVHAKEEPIRHRRLGWGGGKVCFLSWKLCTLYFDHYCVAITPDCDNHDNKAHKANDASSWWWNDCMMMWLHETSLSVIKIINFPVFNKSVTDGQTDGWTNGQIDRRTDRRKDRPSYRDARTQKEWQPDK